MLSRNLKRVLLDSKWPLPPTFLLPWAANLTTVSHTIDTTNLPPPPAPHRTKPTRQLKSEAPQSTSSPSASPPSLNSTPTEALPPPNSLLSPPAISPSVRDLLPLLKAQAPHYITLHIHGKPYLLTQGDTLRLPFLMHGVEPGDVLRLNRAINIGSRDYTLKAAAAGPKMKSATAAISMVVEPVTGPSGEEGMAMPVEEDGSAAQADQGGVMHAPHFIPNIEKGKHSYLDERLFVCRAVVMGVESEPLRIKEKTKRRQRKVKTVKSKHRFTVLRVKEIRVRDVGQVEGGGELD